MPKVLLIDPPFPERPWDINWLTQFPPKGLMYIAAYLRNAGIDVAVLELSKTLKVGDRVRIKGATTDFEMPIESMQIEHESVKEAKKGQAIGLKVPEKVREHDIVYVL